MGHHKEYGWLHMLCSALTMGAFIFAIMIILDWLQAVQ